MNTKQKPADPALCPLCGNDNACGNLQPKDGSTCWCADSDLIFQAELLDQIPDEARGKACICRACATVLS
ncbi:MAG: cysteine-rich CWC family protein [Rhodospirillales bacterium]